MTDAPGRYTRAVSGADKRVFPRYAVEAAVELLWSEGVARGMSRNISRGGLCCETGNRAPAGETATVRITLVFDAERTSEPLEVQARVVWCTPLGDAHQVGTQFLPLSREQQTYLDMFLRYLEEQHATDDQEPEDDPFAA
jgi:hypothetical protein